jgi:uncharacterized protein (TIGR03435 family)
MRKRPLYVLHLAFIGITSMVAVPRVGAQTAKTFDVISIKPDKEGHGLDAGTQSGGRYTARNVPVQFLVTEAFGIKDFQIAGAPKWLNDERYDIVAKAATPNQLSAEQLRPLLQAMLVDRFKLKFHREMKEFPTYSLVVGKSGPKFHQSSAGQAPNLSVSSNNGRASMTGQSMPMSALAQNLAGMTGRTVTDNTGLKGDFNFKLAWAPGEVVSDELPDIFTALQEQLGLKLDIVNKGVAEVIVIEHIEKASAN